MGYQSCEFKDKEYCEYIQLFKKIHFENRLKALSRKYKGKRVLIYGNGIFCDAIADTYNLSDYFNIIGTSDIRYLKNSQGYYKGFKIYSPYDIKNLNVQVVLCMTVNPAPILFKIKSNNILPKGVKFDTVLRVCASEKFLEFVSKFKNICRYFLLTHNFFKTVKYLLFLNSCEINTKINYHNVIENIKKRNLKSEPIRVLFVVEENSKWGYQSVYDALMKDDRFKVLPVLCYPMITKVRESYTQKDNIEFFKSLNIDAIDGCKDGEYISVESLKPDIVFYQQPWYIRDQWHPENVSKYALTCIVSYGYSSIDVKSWGSVGVQKLSANLWKMFCESPYHKKFYEKAAKIKHKDILRVSGYPKMDYYYTDVNPEFEKLWKDEGKRRPRIIWAPHHSIDLGWLEMSNFAEHYKFFLNFAKDNPNYSFIFKPHPSLEYKCVLEGLMSNDEFREYMDEWRSLDNANVWDKGNYFDIFKTSDVLMTDCSSFLGEYYYSSKPIIFLDKSSRCGFNKFGLKMKETFYIPKSLSEIPILLKQLLIDKNDPTKKKRLKVIRKEYFYPKEGVGCNIVNHIRDSLGLKEMK